MARSSLSFLARSGIRRLVSENPENFHSRITSRSNAMSRSRSLRRASKSFCSLTMSRSTPSIVTTSERDEVNQPRAVERGMPCLVA